jgi:hypothetical protein
MENAGKPSPVTISPYQKFNSHIPPARYHWAFLVGPKTEKDAEVPGKRYHVKNPINRGWVYEELELRNVRTTDNLLVRVLIGKVADLERLENVFRSVPVVQNDPNWRCRTWTRHAVEALAADGKAMGTSVLDWQKIEDTAKWYAGEKADAGRFRDADLIRMPKPTWDMLKNKETVP